MTMGELIAAGTPLGELPTTIERQCCPGKSCGNTTAKLHVDAKVVTGQVELSDSYCREGNGDYYFWPQRTLDDLIVLLNEPAFWPADTEGGS